MKQTLKVLALILTLASAFGGATLAQDPAAQAPALPASADGPKSLISRAIGLYSAGDCMAALPLGEKAEGLLRDGTDKSADLAMALVVQALCLKKLARMPEAERHYREAIEIYETVQGPNGVDLAVALDNLASLYAEQDRLAEAEQLRRRALQIFRSTLDPSHPSIATALGNLAVLYQFQGRDAEALPLFLESLAIAEKAYGPESRQVAVIADNLAGLYRAQRQFDKAEPFYVRSISILEKVLGPDHPETGLALQNYAILLDELGQPEKAEAQIKRALGISERLYGPDHPTVAAALNTLALQYIEHNRWAEALETTRRSAAISVSLARQGKVSGPTEGGQTYSSFRRLVQAAFGLAPSDAALANEGFVSAQRALDTEAAAALSQLAARFATNDAAFAALMRERQDLVGESGERDKLLIAAVSRPPDQRDPAGEANVRSRIRNIATRLDQIDLALGSQFPDYASLAKPSPLSIAETQALLTPDEVLVQFLDLQAVGEIPESSFAWFITKTDLKWVRMGLGTHGLSLAVATLRCGLDSSNWTDATRWPEGNADSKRLRADQIGRRERCKKLTGADVSDRAAPPFDLVTAHRLYDALFGQVAPLLTKADGTGKQLLIVPSGPLTKLPFQVLVAEKPKAASPGGAGPAPAADYSEAAWLAKRHAVAVLPSVASLKALRQSAKASRGTTPFVGFGNPLLVGRDGTDRRAFAKQSCPKAAPDSAPRGLVSWMMPDAFASLFRGGAANVASLRRQTPLPETADELCAVARELGAADTDVYLGSRATETQIKKMNADGTLAGARIVHFATHGLIASETQSVGQDLAEPSLMLTPPDIGTAHDDGLLTASEVAGLKLDADWVVLSACNTAAGGETGNAEALSGLARAFFYSGARALLVSHWYVDSLAAVKLTTGAFAELKRDPGMGRAEAMRRSMLAAMTDRSRPKTWVAAAHPAVWAPFVVVGEGGGTASAASSPMTRAAPVAEPALSSTQASTRGGGPVLPQAADAAGAPPAPAGDAAPAVVTAPQPAKRRKARKDFDPDWNTKILGQ